MPMEAQTRLLRVLQQGEYTTVGGRTPIRTNVRIIAATNRDLQQQIDQGLFREDLFYRLNVVPLRLPPLRERLEDIPDLVRHFLNIAEQEGLPTKSFEPAAIERLKRYHWPGNVRELENLVRRLSAIYSQDTVTGEMVENELATVSRAPFSDTAERTGDLSDSVERFLSDYFMSFGQELPPVRPLYPRAAQDRVSADHRGACRNPGQSDPRRRSARAQSQYAAKENSRPRHQGHSHPRALAARNSSEIKHEGAG